MFTVVFETQRAAPGHVVLLRTSKDWNADDSLGAQPVGFEDLSLKTASLGGVAHEVGILRVGGVIDSDLRFLGYDNLYACDNSVFPTSPTANPSLTPAALALRPAEHVKPVAWGADPPPSAFGLASPPGCACSS